MDPLSALSIASAIVAFIDFGIGIIKDAKSIRRGGQLLTHEDFEAVILDLDTLDHSLSQTGGVDTQRNTLNKHEEALWKLREGCRSIAKELIDTLTDLKITGADGRWSSIHLALRSRLKAGRIDELKSRLKEYQSQISTCLMACINAKMDLHHSEQLEHIEKTKTEIIEIFSLNRSRLSEKLEGQSYHRPRYRFYNDDVETGMQSDATAAIVTFSNGETSLIADNSQMPFNIQEETFQPATRSITKWNFNSQQPPDIKFENFDEYRLYKDDVLHCLEYRSLQDRYDSINDAHRKTFDWIYQGPSNRQKPWSNFSEWLVDRSSTYWINGKAASGKSTLMKYLYQHENTTRLLHAWAGERRLICAAYFFWHLGSPIQKSQVGLLRSLLYETLKQCPGLILPVMTDLCRDIMKRKSKEPIGLGEPTLPELKRWLKKLIEVTRRSVFSLAIWIDGVDEFDGDYLELITFIESLCSGSHHVKFILASRPIPACVESFQSYPSLRLQDLTYDDMIQFATDRLGSSFQRKGSQHTQLVIELVNKSSGVFLWVVLVVKSLLDGLQNGDRIDELRERLEVMPRELKSLFSHMIRKVPMSYRRQAYKFLQLSLHSLDTETKLQGHAIHAIKLSFADDSWSDPQESPIRFLSQTEEEQRETEIVARVRSRCCGLLEAQEYGSKLVIQFLHKTVVEYLREEDQHTTWEGSNFEYDPWTPLFTSCIMMAKYYPLAERIRGRNATVSSRIATILAGVEYMGLAQQSRCPISSSCLDDFDSIIRQRWNFTDFIEIAEFGTIPLPKYWPMTVQMEALAQKLISLPKPLENTSLSQAYSTWAPVAEYYFHPPESLKRPTQKAHTRFLAVLQGLYTYLDQSLAQMPKESQEVESTVLLHVWFRCEKKIKILPGLPRALETCRVLLKHGANPNVYYQGNHSIWQAWILSLSPQDYANDEATQTTDQIFTSMLAHGAATKVAATQGGGNLKKTLKKLVGGRNAIHNDTFSTSYDEPDNLWDPEPVSASRLKLMRRLLRQLEIVEVQRSKSKIDKMSAVQTGSGQNTRKANHEAPKIHLKQATHFEVDTAKVKSSPKSSYEYNISSTAEVRRKEGHWSLYLVVMELTKALIPLLLWFVWRYIF
ncbi:hypothetical protein HD806DRAFT_513199 [Xylariaceae sp. AK1471]|nr:hypothetical protein HD806DRAFT_513199 [Xylariaceae sp. AK1471]